MKTGDKPSLNSATTILQNRQQAPNASRARQEWNADLDLWGDRYFERQEEAHCGMHAVNNVIGAPQFLPVDLHTAAMQVLAEAPDNPEEHIRDSGWYSHSVLARALQNAIPPQWRMLLAPLAATAYENLLQDENFFGAVVNEHNAHWSAIVKTAGHLWHVDSKSRPRRIGDAGYRAILGRFPMTFAIVRADYNG